MNLHKKKKKSLCIGKRKKKNLRSSCANGYITTSALVCFFIVVHLLGILSVYILNNAWLIQSNRQSLMDLSCISHAQAMIAHNHQIRKCHLNTDDLILEKTVDIQGVVVTFHDQDTFIDCFYQNKKKKVHMRIYYDEQGLFDTDFL